MTTREINFIGPAPDIVSLKLSSGDISEMLECTLMLRLSGLLLKFFWCIALHKELMAMQEAKVSRCWDSCWMI